MKIWNWVLANLSDIKDLFWIAFTLVTTVVAVLTYRRAKMTLLQPLRSEVIKRQTDNLVCLLDYLDPKNGSINTLIDYLGIIHCNLYMFSEECGFFTEVKDMNDEEFQDSMKQHISGILIVKENGPLNSLSMPGPFDYPKRITDEEKNRIQNEKRVLYKNGIFDNEYLLLTKEFQKFMAEIDAFIENPFTPTKIVTALEGLKTDIYYNIKNPLQDEVKLFMQEMCDKMSKLTEFKPIEFKPLGVVNRFSKKAKSHNDSIKQIRKLIREYLMVDKKLF